MNNHFLRRLLWYRRKEGLYVCGKCDRGFHTIEAKKKHRERCGVKLKIK